MDRWDKRGKMMDARTGIIEERLKGVDRIIAVSSGKGGVGKSMVSSALAISLAENHRVGLLDLDFYGPSAHIILGSRKFPEEKNGIIPPSINGIKFMSIVYFTENKPSPLKGKDVINAIVEILAITIWGNLDYLIIDMPPGIGEEVMAILKYMNRAEFVIVTTPSILSWETVKKLIIFLKENGCNIKGIVENMVRGKSVKNEIEKFGKYLGEIKFDENVESAIGNPEQLKKSNFGRDVGSIAEKIRSFSE